MQHTDHAMGKFVTGIFEDTEQEDYSTAYQRVIDSLKEEKA